MLKDKLHDILQNKWYLRYIFSSIYLNFHYLPFSQAIKLPILVYQPSFRKLKGQIILNPADGVIKRGMVRLGRHLISIYDNHGIMIENAGTIIFRGECELASGTKLSVSEGGVIEFGDKSRASAEVKFVCCRQITIGEDVGIGWETILMDNDLHRLTCIDGSESPDPVKPIEIGKQSWIASHCRIMKGTVLPPRCVVASGSLLNRKYEISEYSLIGGVPAKVIRTGIWRDRTRETI